MANPRVIRPERTCKYCSKKFNVKPSYTNRQGKVADYCSHPCYIAYIKSPDYFWSLVNKTETCWLWTGYLNKLGYGQIRWNRVCRPASRVAYELTYGTIESRKTCVRHKCDNPTCVNPEHLETGTAADNSHDMTERNRQSKGVARHNAKLTPETVRGIRRDYVRGETTLEFVARKYNVSIPTTAKVAAREIWKHVE